MRIPFLRLLIIGVLVLSVGGPGTGAPAAPEAFVLTLAAEAPRLRALEGGEVAPFIRGFGAASRLGEPILPLRVLRVAIPEGSVPELRILSSRSDTLRGLRVARVPGAPARADQERDGRAPVTGPGAITPSLPVRLGSIGYLREQRFVEVLFTPLLYDPAREEIQRFSEVRAEVRFPRSGEAAARGPSAFRPDPFFEETYRRSFVNYEQGRSFRVAPGTTRTSEEGAGTSLRSGTSLESDATTASTSAAPAGYKLAVSRHGLYRLDYTYLSAHAPDLLAVDPRTLRLAAEGVEVPITIRSAADGPGEDDGRFDPGDVLEFYGRSKSESPTVLNFDFGSTFPDIYQANDFTDTQIYWLVSVEPAGSHARIPEVDGTPDAGYPLAPDFEEAALWDQNSIFLPLGPADPFFSIPSLLADSSQAQRDIGLPLPGIAPAAAQAQVTVQLRGGSDVPDVTLDHATRVWINDDTGGGALFSWGGEVIFRSGFAAAQSILRDPTVIHFSLPGVPGVSVDRQYIDTVEIRYRRTFNAIGDRLTFSFPNQDARFQVGGFSGAPPRVYEITRTRPGSAEADPTRITGAQVSGSASFTYTFEVARDPSPSAPAVRTFVVAGPAGPTPPDSTAPTGPPILRDPLNEADFIVIAGRDTVDPSPGGALDNLLAHRRSVQGLTSKVVFMDQIYDEFSHGLRDPNAIRTFLDFAFDNWKGSSGAARPPSFVLLVGDATPDYKNALADPGWIDQVPTAMMFQVSSILGYYSSDNWLASFRGDDQAPDVHLGRISTRSAAASAAVFEKILRYEQAPPVGLWKGRAILATSDGKVAGESDSFESIQNLLKDGYFSVAPYSSPDPPLYYARPPWNAQDPAGFKDALNRELDGGAAVLSYIGHGGFDTWGTFGPLFEVADAEALANGTLLPFMVNVNCLAGGFHYFLASGSLGEAMTNHPSGGAIAALAPSGLSNVFFGDALVTDLFEPLFGPRRERLLGPVTSTLRAGLWERGAIIDLQSYTYLGDPATVLATPAPPPPSGLAAAAGNGEVTLSWVAAPEPVSGTRLYRATAAAGPYAAVTCDPLSSTSCIDRTVLNATTYYYYAVSLDAEGFGGRASNFNTDCASGGPDCVTALPLNPGPPSAPTGLQAVDPGTGGQLQVSWSPNPETDLKNYTLYYGTFPGQYTQSQTLPKTSTSVLLTGLQDSVRYYLALSATNTSGHESTLSAEVSAVPHLIQGIAPPRAISDLTVTRSGADLLLTWSRPTVDIYGRPTTVVRYDIYRGEAPGFRPFEAAPWLTILDGAVTSARDAGAAGLTRNFYYLVTATDSGGLVSGAGRELPNGINDLAVDLAGPGVVRLSWSAVGTDMQGLPTVIDHYQVHMAGRPLGRGSLGSSTLVADNVKALTLDLPVPEGPVFVSVLAVDVRGNLSPF